jgi:glycosyltransferase involved in cell wall biosynthesis
VQEAGSPEAAVPATAEISADEREAAVRVLGRRRVAVFIVAFNAERHLESVVARIPADIRSRLAEIFIIDDSSTDATWLVAERVCAQYPDLPMRAYRTPFNRGYGGNQKLGYLYSSRQKYDWVVLLHGDGQYAPEFLPRLIAAMDDEADAVFGSRMMRKRWALAGGMPLYKWVGNQILTGIENWFLRTDLSEFHTGFRAYRISSLERVPFVFNSDDFHFDTEIIIQAVASRWKIREVAIPTHYGDEKCHVNGLRYAWNCIKALTRFRLVHLGLFYERNFDFDLFEQDNYQFKRSPHSLHQYMLSRPEWRPGIASVELGGNRGLLSNEIAQKVDRHVVVDLKEPDLAGRSVKMALDLERPFRNLLPGAPYDVGVALDVIEHLNSPERFLEEVFAVLKPGARFYASTANIAYLPMRLSLLAGKFNYGKRGILDRTHKRLFSVRSFRKLVAQYGFRVDDVRGFSPPLSDLVSNSVLMRGVERLHTSLSQALPTIFAYNFLVTATRQDDIAEIFARTIAPAASRGSLRAVAGARPD